ncbi:hypothetical protein WN943_013910 [Citrus x changshan-huyou]
MELIGSTKIKELDEIWSKFFAKINICIDKLGQYQLEQIKIFTDAIERSKGTTPLVVDDEDGDIQLSMYPTFARSLSRKVTKTPMLSREIAEKGMKFVGSSKLAELDETWRELRSQFDKLFKEEINPLLSEEEQIFSDALQRIRSHPSS